MTRFWLPLSVVLLAVASPASAAEKAPAGTWKLTIALPGFAQSPFWLFKFEEKDGSWTGKIVASSEELPKCDLSGLSVKNNQLSFGITIGERGRASFEGAIPKTEGANSILGNVQFPPTLRLREVERSPVPAELTRTTITSLDKVEVKKDIIANSNQPAEIIRAVDDILPRAAFLKAKPEEVRGWVEKSLKASEGFGERFQRAVLFDLVEKLNDQDGMAQVALPYARRAERMLAAKDRPRVQQRVLEMLAASLERAGKADEAKEVSAKIKKIDFGVRTQTFPGRTGKNNRVAVFELFTGAECPPCVAADLGFDALTKTFKPSEVVLIQYHLHIPGLDPLTNAHSEARHKYYLEAFRGAVGGTPATLANGAPAAGGGGRKEQAQDKYDQYYDALTGSLDEVAKVGLTAKATRKGDKIEISAKVNDAKETGASVKLRLLLLEEEVDYKGGNGLEKHHHVVRAFPGGVEGVVVKMKDMEHKEIVDVATLKQTIKKSLEEAYKKEMEELPKMLPMELKKLKLVALVQDDNTREILNAVQVDVEDAK